MDNRFSRRWSMTPDSLPTTSRIAHVSPQKHVPPSYPVPSKGNPRQRWTMAPSSSLSIVETIDYDTDDTDSTAASTVSKRERSKAHLIGIMRQIFSRKEKDSNFSTPSKPAIVKSTKQSKTDPRIRRHPEEKEGDVWSRLSVVVRPPKHSDQRNMPKRVDSGVDVRNLKTTEKERGICDSKHSSVSSLHSLRSLPHAAPSHISSRSNTSAAPNLQLSQSEIEYLLVQIKTAITMVKHQESETEAFSKNLAGLLWSKEQYIVANRRLNQATKTAMVETVRKIREQTGKTFYRKGTFFDRSHSVLKKLHDALQPNTNQIERSPSPDSTSTRSSTTLISPDQKLNTNLTLQTLQSALQTLKADLTAHSHLDPALRNTVVLPTQEVRFPTSENEMIAMRRFVKFVDGRVKRLGEGYWDMGRWVRGLESWVDDLMEESK